MRLKSLIAVLIVVLCAAGAAFGCSGFGPDNPKEALKWADVVFTGEIVGEENDPQGEDRILYKFKVEKAWKGVTEKEVTIVDFYANSMCRSKLKVGQRYVIFAGYKWFSGPDGEFRDIYVDKSGSPLPVIDPFSFSRSLNIPPVNEKILKKLGKPKLVNR